MENAVEKTIAELTAEVKEDIKRTESGWDLNVFSTSGARYNWQRGYNNEPIRDMVDLSGIWRQWMRGRLAAIELAKTRSRIARIEMRRSFNFQRPCRWFSGKLLRRS